MAKTKLFTADEKMKIVNEFLSSDISAKKIAEKYNIKQPCTIYQWQNRYITSGISGLFDQKRGRKSNIDKQNNFENIKQELNFLRKEMQNKNKENRELINKVEIMEKFTASLVKDFKNKK
ncbi:helix-turn-helix domain-containing protein [Spiroplasma turonicum]|uniref:Transposase n=1 Tax=Spiroplasma turonicum TaxID=216946 RepID=A0A0K1P6J1_9MOLU|nr:helix-turn-helix domain-containing protein [Spiroplasma turonicum]AKU79824.1 Transposase [Spiroplasma turonicum]ALX70839.1 transposase [Spiroplasma turonicum]